MRAKKIGDPAKQDNTRVNMAKPLPGALNLDELKKSISPKQKSALEQLVGMYNDFVYDPRPDTIAEDVGEFFDPSGLSSHDDYRRAKNSWDKRGSTLPTFNEAVDMYGALPIINIIKKGKALATSLPKGPSTIKKLMRLIDAYDSGQDIAEGGELEKIAKYISEAKAPKHTFYRDPNYQKNVGPELSLEDLQKIIDFQRTRNQ